MKKLLVTALLTATVAGGTAQVKNQSHGYPIDPVPFTSVKVTDSFWGQRLNASREVTIPLAFSKCEETGRYTNFVNAAHPSDTIKVGGLAFDDTDVYKTIEGASYLLQTYPDKKLAKYIDSVLVIVAAAQEPDGYLYTSRTMNPKHPHEWAGSKRWEKVEELSHEFYNLGHMVEGAIAHYQATGKRNFLDIAIRYADCVCREIGTGEGQQIRVPGHQIAEMALAKLYLVTGQQKYLDQAKFFLDQRGYTTRTDEYSQAHKPVVEQDEAVGHAVRAAYMYAGMADVAALTGDTAYIHAIDRIWDNIVGKKYYITGGIGATSNGEAFGKNYELPNMSAYCETCAAIGNVYVNYRLFLLHGEAKYYDVLERTLYNGLISGVSLDGGGFFYPNPLESIGQHQRQPWFGCACCPSNICRFIPSLPGYVYAVKDKDVYVNLFMSNTSNLKVEGKAVSLEQATHYPWNGDVTIGVNKNNAGQNDFDVLSVFMNRTPQFEVVEKPDLLYGINQLKTDAQILGYDDRGRLTATDVKLTLIPYYAWAHRGAGAMAVWLPQELSASRPTMPATLASESKVDASHKVKSISAINDRLVPKDENDRSVPYYHWWPKQGTTEWISYEFPSEATVSSATVYWYDDAPWGGCRIPQSWKMYYKDAQGQWQPVSGADKYGVEKGTGNTVNFDPVKTKAVKLEIVQPADNSSGLFEWEVK